MLSKMMSFSEDLLRHSNILQKALPNLNLLIGQKNSFSSNQLFLAAKLSEAAQAAKAKRDAEKAKKNPVAPAAESTKPKKEEKKPKEELPKEEEPKTSKHLKENETNNIKEDKSKKDDKTKKDSSKKGKKDEKTKEIDDEEAKKRKADKKQRDSALITIAVMFLTAAGVLGFREYKNGGLDDFSLSLAANDKFKPKRKPKTEEEKEYFDALSREYEMIQILQKNYENIVAKYDYKTKNSDIFENVKEELKSLEQEKNNIDKLKISIKQERGSIGSRVNGLKKSFEEMEKVIDAEKRDSKNYPVLKEKKLTIQRELAVTELLLQQKTVLGRILTSFAKLRELREYLALNQQAKAGTKVFADNVYKIFTECMNSFEKIQEYDRSQSQRWINLVLGSDKTISQRMSLDETIISEISLNRQRCALLNSDLNVLLLDKMQTLIPVMSGNPTLSANLQTLIAKNYERQKKNKYQEERQLANFIEAKKAYKADQDKLFIVKVFEALINKTQKKSGPKKFV